MKTGKVWDVANGFVTHNFKGHSGVVNAVAFHPDPSQYQLVSAGNDFVIHVCDLISKNVRVLEGHVSPVTNLIFAGPSGKDLLSSGRDQVIIVWDTIKYKLKHTITVFESVDGMALVQPFPKTIADFGPIDGSEPPRKMQKQDPKTDQQYSSFVAICGVKGKLRIFDYVSSKQVWSDADPEVLTETSALQFISVEQIVDTEKPGKDEDVNFSIVATTGDYDIFVYSVEAKSHPTPSQIPKISKTRTIVGYNDEIVDIKWADNQNTLVVAANSEKIRLFRDVVQGNEFGHWEKSETLMGHTAVVLSIDVSKDGKFLASSSKDNSVRVWYLDAKKGGQKEAKCIGVFTGHTQSVATVAFSRKCDFVKLLKDKVRTQKPNAFVVSGSQDNTIKIWDLSVLDLHSPLQEIKSSILTTKAHDKEINSVAISPNDALIATGSQDRLIKIWDRQTLKLVATLKGHKRGIWSVEFSPVDKCLVSASADRTIKIWSLSDFSCIRTFEGHTASVLRASFLSAGTQVLSCSADSVVKLWNVKTNECANSFEGHEDKIWGLAIRNDGEHFATAGEDSIINIWQDVTSQILLDQENAREQRIIQEQELSNCLKMKQYERAIFLALRLNQPNRIRVILNELLEANKNLVIHEIVGKASNEELEKLMLYLRDWNTSAKFSIVAQYLLNVILRRFTPSRLSQIPRVPELIESILAYTERHYHRVDVLLQRSFLVDYTLSEMRQLDSQKNDESNEDNKFVNISRLITDTSEAVSDDDESDDDLLPSSSSSSSSAKAPLRPFEKELAGFLAQEKSQTQSEKFSKSTKYYKRDFPLV